MKKKLPLVVFFSIVASIDGQAMFVSFSESNRNCILNIETITAIPSNGTPPYTFLWSTGATTDSISNISPGTYTVTVHDNTGDSVIASFTYTNNPNYLVTAGDFWVLPCSSQCNGYYEIWLNYMNGTPPYTFTTSNGGIVNPNWSQFYQGPDPERTSITNLCDGSWETINITDALGCTGQTSMSPINTPPQQNPSITVTPACNSMSNGSVTVSNLIMNWSTYNQTMGYITQDIWAPPLWANVVSLPWTTYNLSPGTYYLVLGYDYTGDYSTWGMGLCPQYFSFNIPDLGPNCSTVEGNVFVDLNANCTEDIGEIGVPNTIVEFIPGPYYAYTDASGYYSTNLLWGNYNMIHYPPATLTPLCPTSPFPISLSAMNTADTVNFADTSTIAFDAAAYIAHGIARPGFDFDYAMSAYNLSYASSGMLTVTLDYDPLLSFVSASPAPFSTSLGQVVWQLSAITNFQSANAVATLSVPPNPSLIGDTLNASVNVQATTPETNLTNNTASSWHIIMGSFDPNMKTVEAPAALFIPAVDGWFDYTIQFQNTGNDTAFNIEVIDSLDSDLDVTTFTPGASSHPYTTRLSGVGVVHFLFNNILLPDSSTDEPNSHGFVSFRIRSKQNRAHGTIINNQSHIVFDFNPPINTNTTANTVDLTLGVQAAATTICEGQSVTLTMIPELQNTPWRWRAGSCSSSIIGSGNSITVSPAVTTTYFVRDSAATMPLGACYRKTITVNPSPIASITPSGSTTFCQGDSVILTSSASSSYLWSDNSTTQSINVTSSGNYFVTVTDANNCSSASPATTVTVNPNPPVPAITQSGDSLISDAATAYQWYFNSVLIPGAISQVYHPTQNGNYSVVITDTNNCTASSADYPFVLTDVSALPGNSEVLIYPNPARDELTVWRSEFPARLAGGGDKAEIIIYSVLGEKFFSQKPTAKSQKQVIDVSSLPRGIYFIKVKFDEKVVIQKIALM